MGLLYIDEYIWNRLFFLRTWIYFFAIITYLFLGNLWYTILATELVEAFHTLIVYVRLSDFKDKDKQFAGGKRFWFEIDTFVSVLIALVACVSVMFVEYVFNSVVFIGGDRKWFLAIFLVFMIGTRSVLVFISDSIFSIIAIVCALVILIFFALLGTNEVFFNDTRTVGITLTYIAYVFLTVVFWAKWLGYYGHLIYSVLLIAILAIFWNKHSPLPLSRYVNWE